MYNCYSPAETAELVSRAGVAKANMRIDKIFMSAVMAGMLLSFACATLLSTLTAPWFQTNAPGLIRTLSALVFPYGLCTIVLTGSDLCTGSFLFTTVAVLHRRLSLSRMLLHWVLTFLGNLTGSLFLVAIIAGYGDIFSATAYTTEIRTFVTTKQITPEWHSIFLRGIGANWLVCLACFLGLSGREYVSKIVGIWWPTFAFVSLGFDHVVANMFFVPMGIWLNTPKVTVGLYIWKGIIPAGLGNIIGGGLFVGTYFWYQYLQGTNAPLIDGDEFDGHPVSLLSFRNNNIDLGRHPAMTEEEMIGSGTNSSTKEKPEENFRGGVRAG